VSRKKPSPPSPPSPQSERPFHAPFAGLAGLRKTLPAAEAVRAPASTTSRTPPRAVVRYERKGRGGKEATVIEQLQLSEAERASWLQQLKQALGCGGALEGEALVLQGDQRSRVRQWLSLRGVARISVG
jgi:translation initiation factor 1